jgi:hypothetical protein
LVTSILKHGCSIRHLLIKVTFWLRRAQGSETGTAALPQQAHTEVSPPPRAEPQDARAEFKPQSASAPGFSKKKHRGSFPVSAHSLPRSIRISA